MSQGSTTNVADKFVNLCISPVSSLGNCHLIEASQMQTLKANPKLETTDFENYSASKRIWPVTSKSSSKSVLSQRVNKRTNALKYTTPEPFPNNRVPSALICRSLPVIGQFGVTNSSRTESLCQFRLYRNQLLKSRIAKSSRLVPVLPDKGRCTTDQSFVNDSPKARGMAERFRRTARRRIITTPTPKLLFQEGSFKNSRISTKRSFSSVCNIFDVEQKDYPSKDRYDTLNMQSFGENENVKHNSENWMADEEMESLVGDSPTSNTLL